MADVEREIRAFIVENFLFGRDDAMPRPDDSLLEASVLDSTGVLELVTYLEERFAIAVEDRDLVPENLDSLRRLSAYVARKQGDGGG